MTNKRIPLSVPSLKGNELKYVTDCIEKEWVSSVGSYVNRFEKDVSAYIDSPHAVACVNGTSALHVSLMLSEVEQNDEVIVPTLTFIAPVNAVRYLGAHPVFMDCDDHLNIDVEKLDDFLDNECVMTSDGLINLTTKRRVRSIIVVHVFGHSANIQQVVRLARQYKLKIIEDATESLGSYYKNMDGKIKYTGTIGDFGCFSFNGNKLITTGGGGMLVTMNPESAARAKYLTTQAKDGDDDYLHNEVGYNYRLCNVQAAIGCAQMEKIEGYIEIKRRNFNLYKESLLDIEDIDFIREPDGTRSNYWFYTMHMKKGNPRQLRAHLAECGVESRMIWTLNHMQQPYKNCQAYEIENAMNYHGKCLNLPCSVNLSEGDIVWVVKQIRGYYGKD